MPRPTKPAKLLALLANVAAIVLFAPAPAAAQTHATATPEKLGALGGVGYLGGEGLGGAAFALGIRYVPLRYLACSFDAGYGVLGGADVQDRWWLMPSVAVVVPLGRVQLDVGLGLGLGASSGYASWSAYTAAPFGPVWALQLVPALRGYVMATLKVNERLGLFLRFDAASLLVGGNSIGSRVDDPDPKATDTVWIHLVHAVRLERTIALRMERPEERISAVASCYSRSATTSYVPLL